MSIQAVETPEYQALKAEIERLKAEAATLRQGNLSVVRNTFSVSLSETVNETDAKGNVIRDANGVPKTKPGKGGIKCTGLGSRFPVTLYREQWQMLADHMAEILAFCNRPDIKAKSEQLRTAAGRK